MRKGGALSSYAFIVHLTVSTRLLCQVNNPIRYLFVKQTVPHFFLNVYTVSDRWEKFNVFAGQPSSPKWSFRPTHTLTIHSFLFHKKKYVINMCIAKQFLHDPSCFIFIMNLLVKGNWEEKGCELVMHIWRNLKLR